MTVYHQPLLTPRALHMTVYHQPLLTPLGFDVSGAYTGGSV